MSFWMPSTPSRNNSGTGEINYKNIFKHIYEKSKATNQNFILGMEHYKSKEGIAGETALLDAYKEADNF